LLSMGHYDLNRIVSKLSIALSDNIFFNDNDIKCPLRYCLLRYNFLMRSLNNSEVKFFLSKGHWYFTRIVSRLSTALSNMLIWHYLRVKFSCPLRYRQHKRHKNEKMTQFYSFFIHVYASIVFSKIQSRNRFID